MPDGIAAWFDQVNYTAADERLLDTVLAASGGATLARPGARPGPGLEVTVDSTGNGTVTLAPGGGVITDTGGGGSYPFVIPAAVARTLGTRPSTGQSRIDELVAVIKNVDARPADGIREVVIQLIPGTPGASPVAPTVPTGALKLRRVTVPASGAIALSNPPQRTAAAGGILDVAGTTERDAITPMFDSQVVFREDNDTYEGRANGEWRRFATQLSKTLPSDVFTPASGITLDDACAFVIAQGLVNVHIKLSGVTYAAGRLNLNLGTMKTGLCPRMYFGPLNGWPDGISGLCSAADGATTLRYAPAAASSGLVVLSGTWPI